MRKLEATCRFYTQVLGIEEITFQQGRKALRFGQQKINLHLRGAEIRPHAESPAVDSQAFCLMLSGSLEGAIAHLNHHQIEIIAGPVRRTRAIGALKSVYIRDPDGNLIELAAQGNEV